MSDQGMPESRITRDDLARVSRTKVFFGHQSVGMNLLDAVPGVYAAHGVPAPAIGQGRAQARGDGGFIGHAFIGEDEQPVLKIQDFATKIRSGIGQQVDVAMMMLCHVDIRSGADLGALFARYRKTIAALECEFSTVTFVHATVPLMTGQELQSRLGSRLAASRFRPSEDAARERLNALIRREYAGGHLFDLAAIHDGCASGPGLLNGEGSRAAATAWLKAVAQASQRSRPVCSGMGTDIVAVARIAALMRAGGAAFLEKWFTAREIDYCSRKAAPSCHFAARFAAKEAVIKALPMAWEGPLPWRSIEIVNDSRGAPAVSLYGAILDAATRAGVDRISVSLSHCDEYATATALVAVADDLAAAAAGHDRPWTPGRAP